MIRFELSQAQQSLQRRQRSHRWLAQQSLVQNRQMFRDPSPQMWHSKAPVSSVGVTYLRLRMFWLLQRWAS